MIDRSFGAEESATIGSVSGDVTIAELQQQLADAAPRLEAFAHLESLADAQNETPKALAIRATLDLLATEEVDRRARLEELQAANLQHIKERDALIAQRDEVRNEIVAVLDEHTATVEQMAEMIEELESIRADAVRLLGEKATLEMKVEALRNEAGALCGEVGRRSDFESALGEDEDEASAFDKFFEAEMHEDKARAWMLE